jgi:hypothetical protein
MVNYSQTKIVSIGVLNHITQPDNIFITTLRASQYLADLKRKYRSYMTDNKGINQPIFDIITKDGIENIIIIVLKEVSLNNKQESNILLQNIKKQYIPINVIIAKNKTSNAVITNSRYESNLKIIMKKIDANNLTIFYDEPDNVIEKIGKLDVSDETKKNYTKSILSIISPTNELKIIYGKYLKSLQNDIEIIRNKQIKSPNVIYKSSDTLNKITLDLLENNKLEDAVISIFYSGYHLPVWRLKEVYTLKWKNYNPKVDNYISWETKEFILNDYKTMKLYGTQTIKIPLYVDKLLERHIKYTNSDSDYVFLKKNRPYTQCEFSKKVIDIFGINLNNLRSMYITSKYNDGLLNTEEQKINLSKIMRNSPDVFKYYIKFESENVNIEFI